MRERERERERPDFFSLVHGRLGQNWAVVVHSASFYLLWTTIENVMQLNRKRRNGSTTERQRTETNAKYNKNPLPNTEQDFCIVLVTMQRRPVSWRPDWLADYLEVALLVKVQTEFPGLLVRKNLDSLMSVSQITTIQDTFHRDGYTCTDIMMFAETCYFLCCLLSFSLSLSLPWFGLAWPDRRSHVWSHSQELCGIYRGETDGQDRSRDESHQDHRKKLQQLRYRTDFSRSGAGARPASQKWLLCSSYFHRVNYVQNATGLYNWRIPQIETYQLFFSITKLWDISASSKFLNAWQKSLRYGLSWWFALT